MINPPHLQPLELSYCCAKQQTTHAEAVRLETLLLLAPCLLLLLRRLAAGAAAAAAFAGDLLLLRAPPLERPLADPLPAAAALGF
jgi:hypothetical protein